MKLFINIIMQIVSISSYSATALVALFGIYELIMGPADAEKLLKKQKAILGAFFRITPKQSMISVLKNTNIENFIHLLIITYFYIYMYL